MAVYSLREHRAFIFTFFSFPSIDMSFAQKQLEKAGWKKGKGLGKNNGTMNLTRRNQ
jgi:hypothetical protein